MILIKSFLTGVAYDCFKIIHQYLNEGDKVLECYSCLKMMVQAYLQVCFFLIFLNARGSLKRLYLYIKLLQSSTIFKQKNNEGNQNQNHNFYNSKNIIATLRIALQKKSSFPSRISSVNVNKSAGNCGFGHIYCRNP